jgi:hypothetical protein
VVRPGRREPLSGPDQRFGQQRYRNLLKTPAVRLSAGDAELSANATPIGDPAKVDEVVEKFRSKYGADKMEAYYSKLDAAVEVPVASS